MSSADSRSSHATDRRLQLLLLVMIAWDALALMAEVSFGSPLLKIDGDKLGGVLAARASMSGASVVTMVMYLFALVRGPVRHRGVLWAGVIELGAGALFAVYHGAIGDIKVEGMIVTLIVSTGLLVLLLLSMPRAQPVAGA
jgi:hypothetical protein